jgi:hypothetical protein
VVVAAVHSGEDDLNSKRIFGLIVNRDRRGRNSFAANSMVYGSKAKQAGWAQSHLATSILIWRAAWPLTLHLQHVA